MSSALPFMDAPRACSGWIGQLDSRLRIAGAAGFAVVVVAGSAWPALLLAFAVSVLLAVLAELAPASTLKRLAAVEGLLVAVLVLLPFTVPGEAVGNLGGLEASREGLMRSGIILAKANAIVLALLALTGTLRPGDLGPALQGLGVPQKLVQLLAFTVRYCGLLVAEYHRLRDAMRGRAFRPKANAHTLRSFGNLVGMLLVRALERAERVEDGMRARGFRGRFPAFRTIRWQSRDSLAAVIGLLVLVLIAALQAGYRTGGG